MRLRIRHETVYAYAHPMPYSMQLLRLTPRPHAGLRVETWRVASDRRRSAFRQLDGFGNVTHAHVVREPHARITLVAEGVVETRDTLGQVRRAHEPLPPAYYLRSTPRTTPDAELAALAADAARAGDPLVALHRLLGLVHDQRAGGTTEDQAHAFVTAARLLGCPARYVGGYLQDEAPPAGGRGHAWADAHHPTLGWLGFDPSHDTCTGEQYVACAVGRDDQDAAPVRGVRHPGGAEDRTVRVAVAEVQQQ
jgi:transglutaminase-like putative cysteine protease